MAFITIPGWPMLYPHGSGNGNSVTFTPRLLDAATEKVAWVFRAPRTGTINQMGFDLDVVTQAPASGLRFSLQDVDASGNPDGAADQFRVITAGLSSDAWIETGLLTADGTDGGAKRSVVQGQLLAAVVEFSSFAASDSLSINVQHTGPWVMGGVGQCTPYSMHFVGGAWGTRGGGCSIFAIQYSDGIWSPVVGASPAKTEVPTSYNSASTPDERGMKFTCPVQIRVAGFWAYALVSNTNSAYKFRLSTGGGTELATAMQDPDALPLGNNPLLFYAYFDDAVTVDLAENGVYRVSLEALGSSGIALYGYTPHSSAYASATQWGEDAVATTRKDTGAWTDLTDGTVYAIGILVTAIDPLKTDIVPDPELTAYVEREDRTAHVAPEI